MKSVRESGVRREIPWRAGCAPVWHGDHARRPVRQSDLYEPEAGRPIRRATIDRRNDYHASAVRRCWAVIVEWRQIELAETRRVGERLDFDNLPVPDDETHYG